MLLLLLLRDTRIISHIYFVSIVLFVLFDKFGKCGGISHNYYKNLENDSKILFAPPPIDEPALMGRYIVNQADWTAVATISTRHDIPHFPMANIKSVSDGSLGNGTGIPYMYLSPFDFTAQDLSMDDRASLMMTLAEGSYCRKKGMDPMDPRCARIILSGRIIEVVNSSLEYNVAKSAVFGRHPWLADMPKNHHFFFAKLDIASIAVIDTFGGAKYVTVQDYLNATLLPMTVFSKIIMHDKDHQRHLHPPIDNPEKFVYRV